MNVNGHLVIFLSFVFLVVATYAVLFSAFLPLTGVYVRLLFFSL